MGQKCNPIGNRLGIVKGWDSNWYGGKKFDLKLVEDDQIRKYLNARLSKAGISHIIIERTLKLVTVTINTARPGIIIGKAGQEVDKLKEELKKLTGKEVQINISEIKRPELDAVIGGQISIDIYPKGNDKSQVLNVIEQERLVPPSEYIFIGDGIENGGNDYPLAELMDNTEICDWYHTKGWEHTKEILENLID